MSRNATTILINYSQHSLPGTTGRWRNNNNEGRTAGKIVKHPGGKGGNGSRAGLKAGMERDEGRELSSSSGTAHQTKRSRL